MKTFLNDRLNKSTKNHKEIITCKKSVISSQICEYNKYLSSSLPKENKTLKKYINEKLNSMNKSKIQFHNSLFPRNSQKSNQKIKNSLIYIKNKVTTKLSNNNLKTIDKSLKPKFIKERIYNKKNIFSIKKNHTQNDNSNENYKSFNAKKIDNSKIINSISISTSAGMTSSSNKNKNEENSHFNYSHKDKDKNNYNYTLCHNSIEKNNTLNNCYNNKRFLLEESNYCNHKINNFNYETGSDDNLNENIVFLKCDNYSSLTFGNSFSYSNSQRSNKYNDENININNYNNGTNNSSSNNVTFYFSNKKNKNIYLNKLKEENEALKKELKESNDQISLLKYQIKELEEINNSHIIKSTRNIVFPPPNIWDTKRITYDFFNSYNSNNNSINMNNKTNKISISFRINERMKIKKEMLEKINNTFNEDSFFKNKKKLINVKKNVNLKKRGYKKNYEEYNSLCKLDKPCEKITECISSLRI